MRRPVLAALVVAAAVLPFLALAAPVVTPAPVTASFTRVEARGDFDVEIREGSPASIEIVAEPGLADRVRVEISGGELDLGRKEPFESARGVVVKVVMPEFRGLSVRGSGKGRAESGPAPREVELAVSGSGDLTWKGAASALQVAVSGSGDLRTEGPSRAVSATVSGSGDLTLAGQAESLDAAVSGSGRVHARELAARDADVAVSGSGDVEVRLSGGRLNARISGSGNVDWWGAGKLGAVAVSGSGRVRQR
jgi:Putative auto-transporter adhesin, head GIN domain